MTVDDLKTGDLVAWRGGGFGAWFVKRLSYWTHIAMVIVEDGRPLLLDAQPRKGVQLSNATWRIGEKRRQDARVAVRCRIGDLDDRQLLDLERYITAVVGLEYERNPWHLIRAGLPLPRWMGGVSHSPSLFCSEVTAEALMVIGTISGRPADSYDPTELFEAVPGYFHSVDL